MSQSSLIVSRGRQSWAELCHLNNPVKCCGAAAATKRVARHLVVIIHKMGLTRLNHNHIYQLNTNPEIRPVQWRNFSNIYPEVYCLIHSWNNIIISFICAVPRV